MSDRASLSQRIARLACEVPTDTVEMLARAVEQLPATPTASSAGLLASAVLQPAARDACRAVFTRWAESFRDVPPVAIAWALRAAAAADDSHRAREKVEVVWTGPTSLALGVLRTDETLLTLIREAKRSLLLVTYAAYEIRAVRAALESALDRGVSIALVVETSTDDGGTLKFDPMPAFGNRLARDAFTFIWPAEKRLRDEQGRPGALHVKAAVADTNVLLVSSANLTGSALAINMELGLLVRGGGAPRRVARHFEELRETGVLVDVSRASSA